MGKEQRKTATHIDITTYVNDEKRVHTFIEHDNFASGCQVA